MLTKEKLHQTIDLLPDIVSIEQVIEEFILLDRIEQGIADADNGNVFSTQEVNEKLSKWLK